MKFSLRLGGCPEQMRGERKLAFIEFLIGARNYTMCFFKYLINSHNSPVRYVLILLFLT